MAPESPIEIIQFRRRGQSSEVLRDQAITVKGLDGFISLVISQPGESAFPWGFLAFARATEYYDKRIPLRSSFVVINWKAHRHDSLRIVARGNAEVLGWGFVSSYLFCDRSLALRLTWERRRALRFLRTLLFNNGPLARPHLSRLVSMGRR
jgi:hypothetical protein